eukprot:2017091-Prymnesium_polylepis.1
MEEACRSERAGGGPQGEASGGMRGGGREALLFSYGSTPPVGRPHSVRARVERRAPKHTLGSATDIAATPSAASLTSRA